MPTGDAYSSWHLVPSLWDLHMFYLLRPILFRTCRYFTGLCSSNIPRYFLEFAYKVLQDTNTTDELMLFIPAISSTISRASSSNVHFTTEVIFLPMAPRGLSERDNLKFSFIPLLNNYTIKVLLHMIVISPHIVCLDRLQSKLAYTKVMH